MKDQPKFLIKEVLGTIVLAVCWLILIVFDERIL